MSKGIKISTKVARVLFLLLKLSIVLIAFVYIYQEVILKENLDKITARYQELIHQPNNCYLLCIILFLMPLNWLLESYKWYSMIQKLEKITFVDALKGVLAGVTISFFTPNRVGEYVGRVFQLQKADKWKATLISILGSMAQLLATILFGLMALAFYLYQQFDGVGYVLYSLVTLLVAVMVILYLIYINTNLLAAILIKVKKLRRWISYIRVFSLYSSNELFRILCLSITRYIIFCTQFVLLLNLLGVKSLWVDLYGKIALVYLTMSVVPTMALSELGVRGSVAIYFIGQHSDNTFGIITASFSLWFINLVIPAIIGAVYVLQMNWKTIKQNKS